MTTITKAPNLHYAEMFQSLDILMAFVHKDKQNYTQLFSPVVCRDFLGDCIWSKKTKKPASIYGFKFDWNIQQYDEDMLRLSLTFPSQDCMEYFKANLGFLHKKETTAGTTLSTIHKVKNEPLTLIIEADNLWQSSTWKISLWTFYLKLMGYKDVTKVKNPEAEYLPLLTTEIEKQLLDNICLMEDNVVNDMSEAHNKCGFVSIIKNHNEVLHNLLLKATAEA